MSDEWVEEIKRMKEETEKRIQKARTEEEVLREKYKEDIKKILDLIKTQCAPVVDTFKDPSKWEWQQPEFGMSETAKAAWIRVPLAFPTSLTLSFRLVLTDKGYSAEVRKQFYDDVKNTTDSSTGHIQPPVKEDSIRSEIRNFLKDRNNALEKLEEKRRKGLVPDMFPPI